MSYLICEDCGWEGNADDRLSYIDFDNVTVSYCLVCGSEDFCERANQPVQPIPNRSG